MEERPQKSTISKNKKEAKKVVVAVVVVAVVVAIVTVVVTAVCRDSDPSYLSIRNSGATFQQICFCW